MLDSLPVLGFATPKGTSMSAFLQPRCTLQPDEPFFQNPWKPWDSWEPRDCVSGNSARSCGLCLRFGTVRAEVQILSPRLHLGAFPDYPRTPWISGPSRGNPDRL